MSASVSGKKAAVELLLAKGANVNAKTEIGHTALISAVGPESDMAVVQALVRAGANINAQRTDGLTALMQAIISDEYEVAKYLIRKGANAGATMNERGGMFAGWTAADLAEWKGNTELAEQLRAGRAR